MTARWERVAEDLRHRIRTGQYPAGTYLPSYRLLAEEEYQVSVGTIRTALLVLRSEGWVEGEPGIGVRVRADHPA